MRIAVTLIFISLSSTLFAQDTLYIKAKKFPLIGQIKYMSKNLIIFQHDSLLDTIQTFLIREIKLANKITVVLKKNQIKETNDTLYINCSNSALKFDVPFLFPNRFSVEFEQKTSSRMSCALSAGFIYDASANSLPSNEDDNKLGGFLSVSLKRYLLSTCTRGEINNWHTFTGSYFKYELQGYYMNVIRKGEFFGEGFTDFGYGLHKVQFSDHFSYTGGAFSVNYGYQQVTNNKTLFDVFIGLGVGVVERKKLKRESTPDESEMDVYSSLYYNTSLLETGSVVFLRDAIVSPVLQLGMRVGFVTGKSKKHIVSNHNNRSYLVR